LVRSVIRQYRAQFFEHVAETKNSTRAEMNMDSSGKFDCI